MIELNPTLKDLLVREAHLRLSREQLKPVWMEKEAALRAVESAPPVFLPFFSKHRRAVYAEKIAAAEAEVSLLRRGMESVERIEPLVKKMIEEQIVEALRGENRDFARAFAARPQADDWNRGLDRLAGLVDSLALALGHAVTQALDAAQAVDDEVKSANRVAVAQAARYLDSGFTLRPLPQLPVADFTGALQRIRALPHAEARTQQALLLEQVKKLGETGIAEWRARGAQIDQAQANDQRNFVLAGWERCRAEVAPLIFAGDTERVVAETEEMLEADAQRSAGEAPEAGESEPAGVVVAGGVAKYH